MAIPKDPLTKAHRLIGQKKYEDALEAFTQVVERDPNKAEGWLGRGDTLRCLNRLEEALVSYDKAIDLEPKNVIGWLWKGELLRDLNRFEDALQSYDKAIEIDPKLAVAWTGKGIALNRLNRPEAALQSYDKAIEVDPKQVAAWTGRAGALSNLNRLEDALQSCDEATHVDPRQVWAWIGRARALSNLNRLEDALRGYDKAIEIDPKNAQAWIGRGKALRDLNRPEDALRSYTRATEIDPDEALTWSDKGAFLARLGRLPEALNDFEKALERFQARAEAAGQGMAQSWIRELRRRIEEQRTAVEPPIDVQIVRTVRAKLQTSPDDDPFRRIKERERQYDRYFGKPRTITPQDSFLAVLRRWNSFTPKLPNREADKSGGGYFLVWKGKGIVIDPGFDFMENFDKAGYSLGDIDAVILTHAHTDHTADFETILCLKYEERQRLGGKANIDLLMNLGTMHKFIGWISRLKVVGNIVTLNAGDTIDPGGYGWTLRPMTARHSEVIDDKSLGLVLELREGSKAALKLGITSDTGWSTAIQRQYTGCKLLCAHLGSIGPNEFDESLPLRGKKRLYREHLGLIGVISMVKSVRPRLCIVSEFGEELGADRDCIAQALDRRFATDRRCLTGDVGLKVRLPDLSVHCDMCGEYADYSDIETLREGETIVYHCSSHTRQEVLDFASRQASLR